MKKNLLLTIFVVMIGISGFAQSLWTKVSEERLSGMTKVDRSAMPKEYQLFQLNFEALKSQLQNAPSRASGDISTVIVSFPNAEGKLEKFRIYEASVFEAPLAASHPELQSYVGQGMTIKVLQFILAQQYLDYIL